MSDFISLLYNIDYFSFLSSRGIIFKNIKLYIKDKIYNNDKKQLKENEIENRKYKLIIKSSVSNIIKCTYYSILYINYKKCL